MKKIIVNYSTREKRFAIVNETKVTKIGIDQPQQQTSVGNIYYGTVTKVVPGINAVFIDIGEDKNGFVHRDKLPGYLLSKEPLATRKNRPISKFVFQGEKLLVQVEKDATGTKGSMLTGIIELHGSNVIYMPTGRRMSVSKKMNNSSIQDAWYQFGLRMKTEDEGLIFRTAIMNDEEERVQKEIEELRSQYQTIVKNTAQLKKPSLLYKQDFFFEQILLEVNRTPDAEVVVDELRLKQRLEGLRQDSNIHFYQGKQNIFAAHGLEQEIEQALHKTVPLENGAYLVFDETEALTIIDVNTGKFSGKSASADTIVRTNLAAAAEIIRQVGLRDIGGMILIDFINMKTESERGQVLRKIDQELKADEKRTRVIGFTPLGILQLTRKKTKMAITEALTTPCPVCEGTGRVLSPETIAFRLERELWEHRHSDHEAVWIETTEAVGIIFSGEKKEHLSMLEEVLGLKILLTIVASSKPFYAIRQFGGYEELSVKANQ